MRFLITIALGAFLVKLGCSQPVTPNAQGSVNPSLGGPSLVSSNAPNTLPNAQLIANSIAQLNVARNSNQNLNQLQNQALSQTPDWMNAVNQQNSARRGNPIAPNSYASLENSLNSISPIFRNNIVNEIDPIQERYLQNVNAQGWNLMQLLGNWRDQPSTYQLTHEQMKQLITSQNARYFNDAQLNVGTNANSNPAMVPPTPSNAPDTREMRGNDLNAQGLSFSDSLLTNSKYTNKQDVNRAIFGNGFGIMQATQPYENPSNGPWTGYGSQYTYPQVPVMNPNQIPQVQQSQNLQTLRANQALQQLQQPNRQSQTLPQAQMQQIFQSGPFASNNFQQPLGFPASAAVSAMNTNQWNPNFPIQPTFAFPNPLNDQLISNRGNTPSRSESGSIQSSNPGVLSEASSNTPQMNSPFSSPNLPPIPSLTTLNQIALQQSSLPNENQDVSQQSNPLSANPSTQPIQVQPQFPVSSPSQSQPPRTSASFPVQPDSTQSRPQSSTSSARENIIPFVQANFPDPLTSTSAPPQPSATCNSMDAACQFYKSCYGCYADHTLAQCSQCYSLLQCKDSSCQLEKACSLCTALERSRSSYTPEICTLAKQRNAC